MHCVDLGESFPTHIFLQKLASTQLRTSPVKFACSPRTDPTGVFKGLVGRSCFPALSHDLHVDADAFRKQSRIHRKKMKVIIERTNVEIEVKEKVVVFDFHMKDVIKISA